MKSINCFQDLARYGIELMTGEACGLTYRILFDLTAQGQPIVEKYVGCKIIAETWGRGSVRILRVFRYRGTAGDRNMHVLSGRI